MVKNLPAIYSPPVTDDVELASALLAIVRDVPQHRNVLVRAATMLLQPPVELLATDRLTGFAEPRRTKRRKGKAAKATKTVRKARTQPRQEEQGPGIAADAESPRSSLVAAGVTVTQNPGNEAVAFDGKTMEVTARQAQLVAMLMRGMPSPVDRDFLSKRLFPAQSKGSAGTSLVTLVGKTKAALAGIGLDVHSVRGVGIVLRPIEGA